MLKVIEVAPNQQPAKSVIIWMHGLGADANDFIDIVSEFSSIEHHQVKYIFPNAPKIPITINNGSVMPGWYDIIEMGSMDNQDQDGIANSTKLINELIQHEIDCGVPSENIILAGFSQGGAMALHIGLTNVKKLGGVISLSAYLPLANDFKTNKKAINQHIPIFMGHGLFDPVVPLHAGQQSLQILQDNGYTVAWQQYPMQHTVLLEEINDVAKFLQTTLAKQN